MVSRMGKHPKTTITTTLDSTVAQGLLPSGCALIFARLEGSVRLTLEYDSGFIRLSYDDNKLILHRKRPRASDKFFLPAFYPFHQRVQELIP